MSNLISYTAPPKAPSLPTREQVDLLDHFRNVVEWTAGHYSISDRKAPDGHARLDLELRRDELAATMGVSDPRAVVQRISRLFMRFPSTRLDGNAEETMAAYAADLSGYPLWVIDAACKKVIAGQGEVSRAFAPSSIELRAICEREYGWARAELAMTRNILDAEIYREPTQEERAKVIAEFQRLVQELKLNEDPISKNKSRPLTKAEAEAALERALINPMPAPMFSPALRAVLGLEEAVSQGEAA